MNKGALFKIHRFLAANSIKYEKEGAVVWLNDLEIEGSYAVGGGC